MENSLPKCGLPILIRTFFNKMHILHFDYKNTIKNLKKTHFLTKICEIKKVMKQMNKNKLF